MRSLPEHPQCVAPSPSVCPLPPPSTCAQSLEPSMECLEELKQKTRELRKGLMATTVIVDASVAVHNEWVSIVTDYVGPQLNHINGKFLDHQVRDAASSPNRLYLLTSTRSFSFESLSSRTDYHLRARAPFYASGTSASLMISREIVWRFQSSLGWEKSAMRTQGSMGPRCSKLLLPLSRCARFAYYYLSKPSALHSSLQIFDLLDATPVSSPSHTLRQILHVAAFPSDNARHPAWNVNPDLDHLSWSNLPQELRKVRTPRAYIIQRSPDYNHAIEGYQLFRFPRSTPSAAGEVPHRGM